MAVGVINMILYKKRSLTNLLYTLFTSYLLKLLRLKHLRMFYEYSIYGRGGEGRRRGGGTFGYQPSKKLFCIFLYLPNLSSNTNPIRTART